MRPQLAQGQSRKGSERAIFRENPLSSMRPASAGAYFRWKPVDSDLNITDIRRKRNRFRENSL